VLGIPDPSVETQQPPAVTPRELASDRNGIVDQASVDRSPSDASRTTARVNACRPPSTAIVIRGGTVVSRRFGGSVIRREDVNDELVRQSGKPVQAPSVHRRLTFESQTPNRVDTAVQGVS
jgi:hypothetical protein